jgi:hypothetical protein
MKLVQLSKMCRNKTYVKDRVGKHFRYQEDPRNKEGLEVNGTHQLLNYADDVNLLGKTINIIKRNTKALLNASK